jgi:hypothetical protein
MRLSREAHHLLESFFREYFGDENLKLPPISLFGKGLVGFFTRKFKIHGITIGRHVFITPIVMTRNSKEQLCISRELLAHEATHVLQFQKLGWKRFFYSYLMSYWKSLRKKEKWDLYARTEAYLEIPQEVEARQCAAEFVEWMRKVEREKRET